MRKTMSIIFGMALLLIGCVNPSARFSPGNATQAVPRPTDVGSSSNPVKPLPFAATTPLTQKCLHIADEEVAVQDVAENGTIILQSAPGQALYLFDLATGVHHELSFQADATSASLSGLHASPDRNDLAYIEDIHNSVGDIVHEKIWVVNAKGKVLANPIISSRILSSGWRWLDENRLQLYIWKVTSKDGTVILLNPFTQEAQTISNDLPNFYKYFDIDPPRWLVDYNNNMQWVIYLGSIGESGEGPIVRDVINEKTIWRAASSYPTRNVPAWSPSGDKVAVIVNGQLIIVSQIGQAAPLVMPEADSQVMGFSWSPNGHYIALLVRFNRPEIKGSLMLYDVQTKQIIDYCIEDDTLNGVIPPVWSVDSHQFVYRITSANIPILVDVQNVRAYILTRNTNILEWMNSLP